MTPFEQLKMLDVSKQLPCGGSRRASLLKATQPETAFGFAPFRPETTRVKS
jgi:hypothetical protein